MLRVFSDGLAKGRRRVCAVVVLMLLGVTAGGVFSSVALAEPACTDTWTGAAVGEWKVAANWSAKSVPSAGDVACLGAGTTVTVNEGPQQANVVFDKGILVLTGGSLEVHNALEPSEIHALQLKGGTLTGAGVVGVSGTLTTEGGKMSGSGTTAVLPGASAFVGVGASFLEIVGRSFVNEGTVTFNEGHIYEYEGAQIKNAGTFKANAEGAAFRVGSGTGSIVNTGLFEKTEGATETSISEPSFENKGTVAASVGQLRFPGSGAVTLASGSVLEGAIAVAGAAVAAGNVNASAATVTVSGGALGVVSGDTMTVGTLSLIGGTLSGLGTLAITGSLTSSGGIMSEAGSTVVRPGATASLGVGESVLEIMGHRFVNEGTVTSNEGTIFEYEAAEVRNAGTFKANAEDTHFAQFAIGSGSPTVVNTGLFEKTAGTHTTVVEPQFSNFGSIATPSGRFEFRHPVITAEASSGYGGPENPSTPAPHPICGDPVSCATGNFFENQTDLSIGGRGVGLDLTRSYNSQAAAAGVHGPFGYGWSSSFSDHLVVEPIAHLATLIQAEGSSVQFTEEPGGTFRAPAWTQDTLSGSAGTGYTLTLPDQTVYRFAGASGRLESVTDRNGNATTLAYSSEGRLETITDPTARKITLAYNTEGLVESAKDPMGHTVKYTYEAGNLATVTEPGELTPRWRFKYDGSHQATEMVDGRGGKTLNEYNGAHQVIAQTDPAEHLLSFEYAPFETKITNHSTGSVTLEVFTSAGLPASVTRGAGTEFATTESWTYDAANDVLSTTDGNNHTTTYEYDAHANRISMTDPEKDETKWTYDSTHDVETTTTPKGETTTIERDAHGNAIKISRPAPESTTQTTKYKYYPHGELESVTDPLERTWKYEYDLHGDRTAEIDPEADKQTWGFDEDSRETSMVSPNGHVAGAKESKFLTTIERDEQGRPTLVTAPLKHETKYVYDANGNLESITDPEGNKTKYTYNGDNQPIKVEEPNGTITETGYDGAGQIITQTDGNKHTTKYTRNVLEEVTEVEDPLKHKSTKTYDAVGNLKSLTDAAKRTTAYSYDAANRLKEVSYSDGKTPTVKYEYDKDGDRTKMIDGTGTSTYEYDQLDRLTATKDGHGNTAGYAYDIANEQKTLTYPNGKAVTQTFDNAGRLKSVTDWSEHTTKFVYDADSNFKATTFPAATGDEDAYAYDESDAMSEVKMSKGAELLASLVYARNKDGGVTKATTKGLPGEEKPAFSYDENSRLTKGAGVTYKYDAANNPTTIGSATHAYNAGNELENASEKKATTATYSYDEVGQRTKTTPATGPATTYGYDQAGNLTSVTRPKEGAIPLIEDAYGYDGTGLRTSQAIAGSTTYMAWDATGSLPLLLSDGTNSYLYGPGGLPVEQINNTTSTVTYLHHDQAGSTRLLTGSAGTVTGKCTYAAYGTPTCEGTATTPLGYDAQYTSSDTGLVYMRARVYDPATAQFMSSDPLKAITGEPYSYAGDNPLNASDPTGLIFGIPGTPSWEEAGEAVAGWGDTITFGATKWVREQIGDENVDTCSGAYQGGGIAGLVTGALIPGEDDAEAEEGLTQIIKTREEPGLDGGESTHIIEQKDGETISVTHRVELEDEIIHQHQTHIGKYNGERQFPDEWIENPTIE